jgi:acetylornithine deacetylase/succinyl-diaminopimelate desuccinylase-like protein
MANLQEMLDQVDGLTQEIVELEQALVRIPSVNTGYMPTGDETKVTDFIGEWFAKEGLDSQVLARDPNRGNIISVYPGENPRARLMFMSHTDVVPVENYDKWRFEPFSATIEGGRIYGRGANDCKALLTCQMMAMAILKRNNVRLKHSLRFVSGADEEHGGRWGFGWLADNHPESMEADFAVNEGGGTPVEIGNTLSYLLGTGEKGRMEVKITFRGESTHASVPWTGRNASYALAKALGSIETYEAERDTSLPIFDHLGKFTIEQRPTPQTIEAVLAEAQEKSPRLASLLRALSRMVLTPTMIHGGIKSNSVPETFELVCDVRTLPFQTEEYVRKQLDDVLAGIEGVEYDIDYMSMPNSSDFETPLAEAIQRAQALAVQRDDIQWVPAISNGFTDSRFTRNLGIVTYGFAGSHPDDDPMLAMAHGTNESVGIASLISGTKCMLSLAFDMCGGE